MDKFLVLEDIKYIIEEIKCNGYKLSYQDIGVMLLDLMTKHGMSFKCHNIDCGRCGLFYKTDEPNKDRIIDTSNPEEVDIYNGLLKIVYYSYFEKCHFKSYLVREMISGLIESYLDSDFIKNQELMYSIFNDIKDELDKEKKDSINIQIKEYNKYINIVVNTLIDLIDTIFPCGQNTNTNVNNNQIKDFALDLKINRQEYPLLNDMKEHRKCLFVELIKDILKKNNLSLSLKLFKKYSPLYGIEFRTIITGVKTLYFENLSLGEIFYFKSMVENEIEQTYNRKNKYYECKNYLLKLIDAAKLDKTEWKYEELIKSTSKETIKSILYSLTPLIKTLNDCFLMLNDKYISLPFTPPKEELNNEARYYLSILIREYGRLIDPQYETSDINYQQFLLSIKEVLDKKYEEFERKLSELSGSLSLEEKKKILFNFLKLGYDNTNSINVKNYRFNNISNIDLHIEKCVDKVVNNEILLNQIVGGEKLNERINFSELEADYTFMVTAQIKSIERFVKEAILKHLGDKYYIDYQYDKETRQTKTKKYLIQKNRTLDSFSKSERTIYDCNGKKIDIFNPLNVELGNINYYLKNSIKDKDINVIFENVSNYSIFNLDFNNEFIQKVRNGHFHVTVINNLSEAQYYRCETAFWLLCVLTELKGL